MRIRQNEHVCLDTGCVSVEMPIVLIVNTLRFVLFHCLFVKSNRILLVILVPTLLLPKA